MPKNCSADVQAVIAHVDSTFTGQNQKEIDRILKIFDFTGLALDDAASAREYLCVCTSLSIDGIDENVTVRNNLWEWQSLTPSSNGGLFYDFCDALEVDNDVSAGPEGWGLEHALQAWGKYWTETYHSNRELSSCYMASNC